jgi:hypothetical protein
MITATGRPAKAPSVSRRVVPAADARFRQHHRQPAHALHDRQPSFQIEHHLFPDLPSNRYEEITPQVRALFERYNLTYTTGSLASKSPPHGRRCSGCRSRRLHTEGHSQTSHSVQPHAWIAELDRGSGEATALLVHRTTRPVNRSWAPRWLSRPAARCRCRHRPVSAGRKGLRSASIGRTEVERWTTVRDYSVGGVGGARCGRRAGHPGEIGTSADGRHGVRDGRCG